MLYRSIPGIAILSVLLALAASPASSQPGDPAAVAALRTALSAMGGEQALKTISSARFSAVGHRNMLEQSERPDGPWAVSYEQLDELLDLGTGSVRQFSQARDYSFPAWRGWTRIFDGTAVAYAFGESMGPGLPADLRLFQERVELGPERVLLTALAAADLRMGGDTILQGVPHRSVEFGWRGGLVRLHLNGFTGLPTAVTTRAPEPGNLFWRTWGDVTRTTYFSFWSLEPNGVRFPRQWDTEWNGLPAHSLTYTSVTFGAAAPPDSFGIMPEIAQMYKAGAGMPPLVLGMTGSATEAPVEVAPGVVVLPGPWYSVLVRQDDGIVILEAPVSGEYSEQVIAEAARRFPGERIKALVSTSDAWIHIGGVRQYIARGVAIHALDLNVPLLRSLEQAEFQMRRDSLARAPRPARFMAVCDATELGAGANRLVLYPARGEGSERMMVVYLPGHRALYASDLLQRRRDGSFAFPQYASEVVELVRSRGLEVNTAFAMHLSPVPFSEVEGAVNAPAVTPQPPRTARCLGGGQDLPGK
jgi:hypothetical protein